jgi:hypothetical protein
MEERLNRIETMIMKLNEEVSYIKGKVDQEATLVRWVIFPLILILAGLIGLKLTMPT